MVRSIYDPEYFGLTFRGEVVWNKPAQYMSMHAGSEPTGGCSKYGVTPNSYEQVCYIKLSSICGMKFAAWACHEFLILCMSRLYKAAVGGRFSTFSQLDKKTLEHSQSAA